MSSLFYNFNSYSFIEWNRRYTRGWFTCDEASLTLWIPRMVRSFREVKERSSLKKPAGKFNERKSGRRISNASRESLRDHDRSRFLARIKWDRPGRENIPPVTRSHAGSSPTRSPQWNASSSDNSSPVNGASTFYTQKNICSSQIPQ
jgi:hypothetical protein